MHDLAFSNSSPKRPWIQIPTVKMSEKNTIIRVKPVGAGGGGVESSAKG